MFTTKATVYFSLAISLLTAALLLDDFEIGVLVLGLASLFFLSNTLSFPEKVDIKLSRTIDPNETFGDQDVRVTSRVRNMGKTALANIELWETIEGEMVPEKGLNSGRAVIPALGESKLVFEFPSPPRAIYQIGPLVVRVRDPFGLYLVEKTLPPDTLAVMPRPESLTGVHLRPRHVGPWPGVIPSKILGVGTEFYSLREYVQGDDPKRMNWKASAKYNALIVNQTEAERVTDIMIVLDTDVGFYGPGEAQLFEQGVQAAASIAHLLLRLGNRVGLVLQGGERGSIPAGFGKRHEKRILYLLAEARPGRASVSTSYVMNLLARRMLPSRAQIVIISPLLDPEIKEGVRQLTIAGYSMLVLSPAPSAPSSFKFDEERIAFKLVMLERSITLLGLERSATVIDWSRAVPLSVVLSRVRRPRIPALA